MVLAEETAFTQPLLLLFMVSTVSTFTMYYLWGGSRHSSCKARPVRMICFLNLTLKWTPNELKPPSQKMSDFV